MLTIENFVKIYCYQEIEKGGYLEKLVDDIAQRKANPHAAALKIIDELSKHFGELQPG